MEGFQNSPLFLHYLFFLIFYCALFGTHLTCNSNTPPKQKVWSVLACRTKATVTSIVLLIKYAHMPWYISRSACRGMHACPCHHLFVGFQVDGQIYSSIFTNLVFHSLSDTSNTKRSISSAIETLRSGLKKQGAAKFF